MVLNHSNIGTILIIQLPARLDTGNAPEAEADLKTLIESSFQSLLFDCSDMSYISSSGIRVILSITKGLMKSGKKVAYCNLKPGVRQVFEIGGFTRIFSIYDSQDAAVKKLE